MTTHHFKTTCQCPLYQTLHISYTNMSKLHPYYTNVHHINHCTLSMPVSTISKTALSYAKQQKLCPYTNVHHIKTLHFAIQTCPKLCPYTNVHHIKSLHFCWAGVHYIFPIHTCQNCVHKQASTTSITTLFIYKQVKIALLLCFEQLS
jgi:hypothetical protein